MNHLNIDSFHLYTATDRQTDRQPREASRDATEDKRR